MTSFLLAVKNPGKNLPYIISFFQLISAPFNYFFAKKVLRPAILSVIVFVFMNTAVAQNASADYVKTVTDRSAKIVNTLEIKDSATYNKVLAVLVLQYKALNDLQESNKVLVEKVKEQTISKEEKDTQIRKIEEEKNGLLVQLHSRFISLLNQCLSEQQVEKVKDGMTYRILPITYAAYLDEIPRLTKEQKEQIYAWLKEARELAIDAESSEKKHAVFGKYKGRINNFLSAAGYDMKKEGEEWQKRIKAREAEKKQAENR